MFADVSKPKGAFNERAQECPIDAIWVENGL